MPSLVILVSGTVLEMDYFRPGKVLDKSFNKTFSSWCTPCINIKFFLLKSSIFYLHQCLCAGSKRLAAVPYSWYNLLCKISKINFSLCIYFSTYNLSCDISSASWMYYLWHLRGAHYKIHLTKSVRMRKDIRCEEDLTAWSIECMATGYNFFQYCCSIKENHAAKWKKHNVYK